MPRLIEATCGLAVALGLVSGCGRQAQTSPAPAAVPVAPTPAAPARDARAQPAVPARDARARPPSLKPIATTPTSPPMPASAKIPDPSGAADRPAKRAPLALPKRPTGAALVAAKRDARRLKRLLNQGRVAVKAKDFATGIARYEAALRLDPNDPSVLGELGWAAYLSRDLERARTATTRALTVSKRPHQRAMLLYNLGRIEEDEGHADRAISAYGRSLSLRDNATVRARHAALTAAGSSAARYTSVKALCEDLLSDWACDEEDADCTCEETEAVPDDPGPPPYIQVRFIRVEGMTDGEVDALYAAIERPEGLSLIDQVTEGWIPGVNGIFNEGRVIQTVMLSPNLLFIEAENSLSDTDLGYNALTLSTTRTLWICRDARCAELTVASSESIERLFDDGEEPPADIYGQLGERHWSLDWSVHRDGTVVLRPKTGSVPKAIAPALGRHSVGALMAMTGAIEVTAL